MTSPIIPTSETFATNTILPLCSMAALTSVNFRG